MHNLPDSYREQHRCHNCAYGGYDPARIGSSMVCMFRLVRAVCKPYGTCDDWTARAPSA